MNFIWRIHGTDHDLSARGMVMGIVNVTPDSFSDGGRFSTLVVPWSMP